MRPDFGHPMHSKCIACDGLVAIFMSRGTGMRQEQERNAAVKVFNSPAPSGVPHCGCPTKRADLMKALRSLRQERDKWRDRAEIAEAEHGMDVGAYDDLRYERDAAYEALEAARWSALGWKRASKLWRRRAELLRTLIREHNAECVANCKSRGHEHCAPYTERGRICTDCPREWLIETGEGDD